MLLEVSNISKTFGGVAALRDVNFGLDEGQLLALVGLMVQASPLASTFSMASLRRTAVASGWRARNWSV